MKCISLNIECNLHYDRIFPFLEKEKPDVICLQEVLEDDFEFLKNKFGMAGVFKAHSYNASTLERYTNVRGKRFGVAIFSKKILESNYFFYWGNENNIVIPLHDYLQKKQFLDSFVLLWADIQDTFGNIYRFTTTHFPVTENGVSNLYQLEMLPSFFKKLDEFDDFVLCGDFNAPRGNETFRRIAEKYQDNIPEQYITSLDQKLHRFPGIMFMVDGLFTTSSYQAKDVSLVDGLSDHMAIVATIIRKD